jgi:hypothetical protein
MRSEARPESSGRSTLLDAGGPLEDQGDLPLDGCISLFRLDHQKSLAIRAGLNRISSGLRVGDLKWNFRFERIC